MAKTHECHYDHYDNVDDDDDVEEDGSGSECALELPHVAIFEQEQIML